MKTTTFSKIWLLMAAVGILLTPAARAEWRCENKNFLLNARCQYRTEVVCTSHLGQTVEGFIDGGATPDQIVTRIISNTGVQFEHREVQNSQGLDVNRISQYAVNTPQNRHFFQPRLQEEPNTTYTVISHGQDRQVPRGDSISELWSEGFVFRGELPKLVKDTRRRWQTWSGPRVDQSDCPSPSAAVVIGPGPAKLPSPTSASDTVAPGTAAPVTGSR